jgi:hypothetical protein
MTKKLDSARFMRNAYKAMRKKIMNEIIKVLKDADDNELFLEDNRGSLVVGGDDQESQVIQSIYLRYPDKVIAKIGIYGEPLYDQNLDEMNIEMILNVFDAVEVAVNDPE